MSLIDIEISAIDTTAGLLKAAADPLRLSILKALAQNSYNVAELCNIFSLRQPALSHHLKLLANAELISSRKEGTSTFYRRSNNSCPLIKLRSAIFEQVDALELDPELRARIADIHSERANTAELFFASNAATFAKQQDLIADFHVYGETVAQVIERSISDTHNRALEIGPGRGELLPYLSSKFQQVVAADISLAMLESATHLVQSKSLHNVTLLNCDTSTINVAKQDLIVLNMVLHHTPDPAQIFADLSPLLNSDGTLVICELVRHEQTWVKDACGDLWQGFDRTDLIAWANQAGLVNTDSEFFALRNGFQFQILTFNLK